MLIEKFLISVFTNRHKRAWVNNWTSFLYSVTSIIHEKRSNQNLRNENFWFYKPFLWLWRHHKLQSSTSLMNVLLGLFGLPRWVGNTKLSSDGGNGCFDVNECGTDYSLFASSRGRGFQLVGGVLITPPSRKKKQFYSYSCMLPQFFLHFQNVNFLSLASYEALLDSSFYCFIIVPIFFSFSPDSLLKLISMCVTYHVCYFYWFFYMSTHVEWNWQKSLDLEALPKMEKIWQNSIIDSKFGQNRGFKTL